MTKSKFVHFILIFYMGWAIKELTFHPKVSDLGLYLLSVLIKLIFWIGLVIIYFVCIDQLRMQQIISYLKLKPNVIKGVFIGGIIGFVLVVIELAIFKGFSFDIGIRWIITPLAAFSEEVVFRGFVMNKLRDHRVKGYNFIQAILFMGIHFPIGIISGYSLLNYVTIFLVGYILGFIYKKTSSIWAPTIGHSVYNILVYLRQ
ncbi:CPBP family intramembrane glutamic endopeptidase [Paenibacillus polymyxa]|uniref:CPBP family intramembrane glutamic endopeptidase n=1 Tax=Paenibacillus polymyxa TaxID=1406 RepID=UPI002AB5CBF4|nr:CPBP family intramembrane glutamic endopeptidase [Paenibacillus polymyxa]MDY7992404.1 CPBP family intramembrane glutamic endopeptidase [Paenibacillus polymyxa]MDY8118846.1 CPBP family intramembrane glutamic endopeptidase [Paenibacillus polymyxa]